MTLLNLLRRIWWPIRAANSDAGLKQLEEAFVSAQRDPAFQAEFIDLLKNSRGPPDGADAVQKPHRRQQHRLSEA